MDSLGAGYMAVFAASGSVVLLALQVHKRLLSDFMKKMEFEIGHAKYQPKKKARLADDVMMKLSSKDKVQTQAMKKQKQHRIRGEKLEALPLNWQALYKGIIQYRALRSLD